MPKSKTANVTAEAPVAAEPRKRTSTAKPKTTAAAATHKRTASKTTKPKSSDKPSKSSTPATAAAEPAITPRVITQAEIATLAYSYWEERGYCGGSPLEDWLRAERELTKLA